MHLHSIPQENSGLLGSSWRWWPGVMWYTYVNLPLCNVDMILYERCMAKSGDRLHTTTDDWRWLTCLPQPYMVYHLSKNHYLFDFSWRYPEACHQLIFSASLHSISPCRRVSCDCLISLAREEKQALLGITYLSPKHAIKQNLFAVNFLLDPNVC